MHTLSPLPYAYDALEPYISADTLRLHHDKHHQAYVNKLNLSLEAYPDLLGGDLEQMLRGLSDLPEEVRNSVRQNGGQHYNHTLYWQCMSPASEVAPEESLSQALTDTFGSLEAFWDLFAQAGVTQFGSGWAWLSLDPSNKLLISQTSNGDNPLMQGHTPILTMDVWEHAYYVDYQNRRPDYVSAFRHLINWPEVSRRYNLAISK